MPTYHSFRPIRTRRSTILACAALFAAAATAIPMREAAADTFECELGKSKVRVEGGRISRLTSTTFEDVPSTLMHFTQGGDRPGCVIIQFSASVYAGRDRDMQVRAVLVSEATGISMALQPGDVRFAGNDDDSVRSDAVRARTFNFAIQGVAPGRYTAKMQWESVRNQAVFMHERTTIVQHQ